MAVGQSTIKTLIFWLILTFVTLVLIELVLHGLCLISPRVDSLLSSRSGLSVPDKKLGWRPNPNFPDHDAKGFRNRDVPKRAPIVALGDSLTYGVWAKRKNAWPQQLERMAGVRTYNMGFSGYDPTRSLLMLDEALELHPKLVIEALFLGNDLWEAYSTVYDEGRLPDMKTADKELMKQFSERDKEVPVMEVANRLFEPHRELKDFLAENSKIYALLWLAKRIFFPNYTWPWYVLKFRASRFAPWEVFEYGHIHTILSPAYRIVGLDQADPRNREGLRIVLETLGRIDDRLKKAGVRFLVVFLPTKELVVEPFLDSSHLKSPENYRRLVKNEKLARNKIERYLREHGIPYADATPWLRESIRKGKSPYLINLDVHPDAEGHRAIAAGILSEIRSHKLLEPR